MHLLISRRLSAAWIAALAVGLCAAGARAVPAPEDVVMYEVNLRAFSQAGDLAGVTARLDEIQALGANTLYLMPIHPIGQINSVGQLGSPYSVRRVPLACRQCRCATPLGNSHSPRRVERWSTHAHLHAHRPPTWSAG